MSDFKHKEGFGSLTKNNFKETEKHPDLTGEATSPCDFKAGDTIEISAWGKKDKNGNKMLGLTIQPPFKKKVDTGFADMSDDIPFN